MPFDAAPAPITHYENFPVASWLCPPALRPAIASLYGFARTADDIADEGNASASERLQDLKAYGEDLSAIAAGLAPSARWAGVFWPLQRAITNHALPLAPLQDLLSAFEQDVRKTAAAEGYQDRAQLLDYCRRSANPVGRLMLHLYGVQDAAALAQSDSICTALQLINFWQDLSVDVPRGRSYVPATDAATHGWDMANAPGSQHKWLRAEQGTMQEPRNNQPPSARADALIAELAAWARQTMLAGAPLVRRMPGRAGWELRFVVQGALRVLDKVEHLGGECLDQRPRLRSWDAPILLARALRM